MNNVACTNVKLGNFIIILVSPLVSLVLHGHMIFAHQVHLPVIFYSFIFIHLKVHRSMCLSTFPDNVPELCLTLIKFYKQIHTETASLIKNKPGQLSLFSGWMTGV
jgi:hypothetical protein